MKLDTNYLSGLIKKSGYKRSFIAECMGMTNTTFYNKSHGNSPFTYEEAMRLFYILKVTTDEEKSKIFLPNK